MMDEVTAAEQTKEFGYYGIKDPRDRYADRLYDPENDQGPLYRGLYVVPIPDERHVVRHVIVRMQQVHEGGMRQYLDPVSGEIVGSCGLNYACEHILSVEDWLEQQAGIRIAELQIGRQRRWVLPWRARR